jgi:hypothetical protein
MKFELSDDEIQKVLQFYQDNCEKQKDFGAIGGSLTYEFTPTSLGLITKVIFCQDTPNEATLDLTEYGDW